MKTCPKCGFENESANPDCLKCGVNFAKVERARSNEQEPFKNEAIVNRKIEKVMGQDTPEDEAFYFQENEAIRDRESYPFIEFLSTFFLFLAALVGIAYIVGAIHFWDFLTQLSFFETRDKIFLLISITLADAISVGTLLAISAALTLGRDIANNTRASRECLFKLLQAKPQQ
jgi:hypothetical protein